MEKILSLILKLRNKRYIKKIARFLLQLIYTIDIPNSVVIGENIKLVHNSPGLVLHPNTKIGNNVRLYQGVTLGRADIYNDIEDSKFKEIIVNDNAVICAGAKILCKEGTLVVGEGCVIGANSVLTCSTSENEIWAGIPAKKIGYIKQK